MLRSHRSIRRIKCVFIFHFNDIRFFRFRFFFIQTLTQRCISLLLRTMQRNTNFALLHNRSFSIVTRRAISNRHYSLRYRILSIVVLRNRIITVNFPIKIRIRCRRIIFQLAYNSTVAAFTQLILSFAFRSSTHFCNASLPRTSMLRSTSSKIKHYCQHSSRNKSKNWRKYARASC